MGPVFAKGYTPNSEQLIAVYNQIPSHSFLQQNIHYHASRPVLDSFPESVSTGQSFVIDLSLSEEALWNRLASDYRNNKIKKARMKVELSFAMTVEDFYQLNVKSFSNQRANFPVPPRLFKSIISGLVEKKSAILIGVCDKSGHFHAGACIAWDSNSVYYHSAGTDPNLRSSGGGILLIWEAIRWAKEHHQNKQFDFLGSNIKGIARVWKNFGAKKKEYVILTRERSTFFKYLRKLKYKLT
jgi:hypothetical protein